MHTFWRGDLVVETRSDETADIYQWQPNTGSYVWHSDWESPEQAHRYIEEQTALPEFPEIKPINASVHSLPKLQSIFDRVWTKQQARKAS